MQMNSLIFLKKCLSVDVKKTQMHRFWGETVILSCHNPRGLEHTVKWMKGDDVIENKTKPSLRIQTATPSDSGTYTCKNGPYTSKIDLRVALRIDFLKRPYDISVIPGSTIKLTYKMNTDPGYILHGIWMHEKQIVPEKQFKDSLELKTGELTSTLTIKAEEGKGDQVFEFTVKAKKDDVVVGERKDSSIVTVTNDICKSESPCSAMGKCKNEIEGKHVVYECHCEPGFAGSKCDSFDSSLYGIKGKTYFVKKQAKLKLACNFGANASLYRFEIYKRNETEPDKTVQGKSIFENLEHNLHDDALITCHAIIRNNGKLMNISDTCRINFLKEYDYGDSIDLKEKENNKKVVLKHNGVFFNSLDMTSHKITAVSTPGTLQVISYGSGREEKHVVCPRRVTQRNLVLTFTPMNIIESIATVILIFCTKSKGAVKRFSKRFSKQKTQAKNSTVKNQMNSEYKWIPCQKCDQVYKHSRKLKQILS